MKTHSDYLRSSLLVASVVVGASRASAQPAPPVTEAPPPEPPAADPAEPGPAEVPPAEAAPPVEAEAPAPPPMAEPPIAEPPEAMEPAPPIAPQPPAPPLVEPAPAPPPAETGPEFLPLKIGGSIWSRYELRSGYHDHGLATHPRFHREGDYIVSRARMSFATNPVDVGDGVKVSGTFVPQAAYTFGETPGIVTIADHPTMAIYEGYASVGSDNYRFDVGRFMLNYGDAFILGNLDWNENGRAHNGARLRLTPGASAYYVDVIGSLLNEGRITTAEPVSGDLYLYGVYAGLGPLLGEGMELDFYALAQTRAGSDDLTLTDPADSMSTVAGNQEGATEVTLGGRLKGTASVFDYRAEAGVQFGQSPGPAPTFGAPDSDARSKFAYQVDAEVGVKPIKPFRIGLEGAIASGDDPTTADEDEGYNELYPTTHKWLGLMDVVGLRTNIVSAVLHLRYSIVESLAVSLDAHYFTRPEPGPTGEDGTMGQELDAQVFYDIGKGFGARGLYGVFLANEDYFAPVGADASDPLHYVEVEFGYNFK